MIQSRSERRRSRRSLVDYTSAVPMWCCDADTSRVFDANEAALRFWRYEREHFIGMPSTNLLCPEELARQAKLAKMNLWGETGPWKCRRGDGSILYVKVRWQRAMSGKRVCDFVFLSGVGESVESIEAIAAPAS
jgi:PAS domain-containing protein